MFGNPMTDLLDVPIMSKIKSPHLQNIILDGGFLLTRIYLLPLLVTVSNLAMFKMGKAAEVYSFHMELLLDLKHL